MRATDDEAELQEKVARRRRLQAYAWITVLSAAVSLYIVVLVAGARAPSVTPFLAGAVGAAGAACAAIAIHFAGRKLPLKLPHRAVAIALAFALLAFSAGGSRYTYGGSGELSVSIVFSPLSVAQGEEATLTGAVTLFNTGGSTVRVHPHFALKLTSPSGAPILRLYDGCTLAVPPPPVEGDLVELQPDGTRSWPFALPVAWTLAQNASEGARLCGAALLGDRGNYEVLGTFTSGSFNAPLLVPVWSGYLATDPWTLTVR